MALTPQAPELPQPVPRLLQLAGRHLAVGSVDHIWIFPPRRAGRSVGAVAVISCFDHDDRRRIYTAHLNFRSDDQLTEQVLEHGAAPTDRVQRLIDGVLRRLDGELALATPHHAHISGDDVRWAALLADPPFRLTSSIAADSRPIP